MKTLSFNAVHATGRPVDWLREYGYLVAER